MLEFQAVLCDVQLGGDRNQTVTNKRVTVPELAVLRALHGPGSVSNIRVNGVAGPLDVSPENPEGRPRTESAERERLVHDYPATDENGEIVAVKLFPSLTALPRRLRDIGIDAAAEAKLARERAKQLWAQAEALESADDGEAEELDPDFDLNAEDEPGAGSEPDLPLEPPLPPVKSGKGGRASIADLKG